MVSALELSYDKLLSRFAFKFNLRRYSAGDLDHDAYCCDCSPDGAVRRVDPFKPTLKAPGSKHLKVEHENLLSSFAFKFNLRRYSAVNDPDTFMCGSCLDKLADESEGE